MKAIKILALAFMFSFILGCSEKNENPTYTIYKKGKYFKDRQYDVIKVYGFGNNDLLAREILETLNKEEPNMYHFERD